MRVSLMLAARALTLAPVLAGGAPLGAQTGGAEGNYLQARRISRSASRADSTG
jgi:hypothetical protein